MSIRCFICPDGGKITPADCLKEGGCRMGERCATRPYLILCSTERPQLFRCTKCRHEERLPASNKQFAQFCPICKERMEYVPSTTQLIAGTKQAFLRLTTDYDISPDSRAFMIQGTKTHANLEAVDDEFSLLEEKFSDENNTGISDVITTEDGLSTLSDYKNTGSFKVQKALGFYIDEEPTGEIYKSGKRKGESRTRKVIKRDESKRDILDWALQLNDYRIKAEHKLKIKIQRLKIQAIVRDGNTHIARSRGIFRNIYYFDVPIMPDEEVKTFFEQKRKLLLAALKAGEWEQICDARECWDGIKCARYCEVAESCPYGKFLKHEKQREGEMPIQGLSEARRLPRMGKIRLGITKINQNGKEYPAEVKYFILDPEVENDLERQKLLDIFEQKFGKEPTLIKIMLPVADPEKVFPQYYKSYGQTTMLNCKGDGTEATTNNPEYIAKLKNLGDGELGKRVVCAGKNCPFYLAKKCTESATLNVLLPDLPGVGVWQITTGSIHAIINLNSCLHLVKNLAGRFHMIPLTLERREQEITHEGKKAKHYIMHINMDISLAELQRLAKIDPERITMELPTVGDEKKDLYLEHNPVVNPPKDNNGESQGPAAEDAEIVKEDVAWDDKLDAAGNTKEQAKPDTNAVLRKEIGDLAAKVYGEKKKFEDWLHANYKSIYLKDLTPEQLNKVKSILTDQLVAKV